MDGARRLLEGDARFHFLRRDITRPASAGGEDHRAVTPEEFQSRLESGAYALHWRAHDLLYGIPVSELTSLSHGRSVIANGSRSVIDAARAKFDRLAIVSITAEARSLRARLEDRGREDAVGIERRIERAMAFRIEGDDVVTIDNDGSIQDGIDRFVYALVQIHQRLPA